MTTDWVTGADPSWFPRVLRVLQRDWPEIASEAWSRAIAENAAETRSRGEHDQTPEHAGLAGDEPPAGT